MKKYILVFAALAALAACGGSGTPTTLEPKTRTADAFDADVTSTSLPSTITVDYSEATDQFTFAEDGTGISGLIRREEQDNGMILGFRDEFGDLIGYAYRSDNGQVAILGSDDPNFDFRGATIERFGPSEVPLTGEATFNGDYAGLLGQRTPAGNTDDIRRLINGDVTLTADFADNTIFGAITNREFVAIGNRADQDRIFDLTLNSTTLDGENRFTGVATGGGIEGAPTSNGSFTGAINGDAEEAIGILTLDHDFAGEELFEWGIFVAKD